MYAHRYFLPAIFLILVSACDQVQEPLPKVEAAEAEIASASQEEGAHKKEFMAATRQELDKLQHDLDALKEKMANESAKEKERMKAELENFQKRQRYLEKKWRSFREEGSNNWKSFEKAFMKAIADLREEIHKMNAKRS